MNKWRDSDGTKTIALLAILAAAVIAMGLVAVIALLKWLF